MIDYHLKCKGHTHYAGQLEAIVAKFTDKPEYEITSCIMFNNNNNAESLWEGLSSIGVTNWRRRAKSRSAWKEVLRQAEIR